MPGVDSMAETITITMEDGHEMPVYHALPAGERRGGLVLVQEIFGVTDHIREMCDEYAADGYEVLSPSLFDRIEIDFPNKRVVFDLPERAHRNAGQRFAANGGAFGG